MEALSGSIQALEIAKLKNGTEREQIEAQYAEILQTIDTVDAAVADNVLENNLANEQAILSLETQRQSLDAISIDRPNLWNATYGLVYGKIGEGWSLLTKDVICGMVLDPASKWLKDVTKDIPVLNVITEVGTNIIIDFPSGVIEGAGELVNGVGMMIAHPVDTIAGIGTLIGRNPQTGEWALSNAGNAWREMGKALIAYENFERGEVGKGVGKVALNVLLTATGIGAAAKGAQGASIAYSVARASGAGVARATLRATGTGARLFAGEFSHGVARLPGEAVSATGKLLRTPGRLLENMKLGTAGRLGKEISEMGDELSKVSKGLEDFTISGKKVSELEVLSGKNSRELAKFSPDDLAKAGIKDSGAIREFLEYKKALKKSEQLAKVYQTAKTQAAAELEAKAAKGQLQVVKSKTEKLKPKIEEAEARLKTATGEAAETIKEELKVLQGELKELEKNLKGAKAKDTVARIKTGEIKGFENYEGIRDLAKAAGLSMEEQFQLTKRFLENSGKKIEDLIRMEDTIGPLKDIKVAETMDDIVKGAEGVEKVIAKLGEAKTLKQMDTIISGVASPAERQLLEKLAGDLGGIKGAAIEEAEKVTILKESMRYLQDYKAAMREGGMGSAKSAQDVFDLIRGNQRKLAHQTVIDRAYFTGSDHGVTHILDANMAMADKIFVDMGPKISAKDRVLIRQAILDHDMGYTINALEGAKKGKYFGMTKDHPLYSTVWVESKKAEYVKYFGEEGYSTIRSTILDHSNVAKLDMTATGSKLVENIVAGVDCLGTTADIKMTKLFREPEMMVKLMQLQELAEQLKAATTPVKKAALIQEMKEIKKVMKTFVKKNDKFDKPMKESFLKALDRNFDPTDPTFAFKRDFGSHSAGFERISVADNGYVTVNMSVNENFRLVREMFVGGDEISTSALAKAMDDYGLDVTGGKKPIATVTRNGVETTIEYSQAQFAADLAKVEKGEMGSLVVKTQRATFNFTRNTEKGKKLGNVLKREGALKEAIRELDNPNISPVKAREVMQTLTEQHNWEGYILDGKPAKTVIREIHDLSDSGKKAEAVQLLKRLRFKGTKLAT